MAKKITKLQNILNQLSKGKLISGKEVREALKVLEINTLKLKAEELQRLVEIVEEKKASTVPATKSSGLRLEQLISEGQQLESGEFELAPTTFNQLAIIGKEIGKTQGTGYQLGHVGLGNLAQRLAFILQNYKVEGQRSLTIEEKRLIESAIVGAQIIERLPEENLNELKRIDSKDADVLLKALSFIPDQVQQDLIASSKFEFNAKLGIAKIQYEFEDLVQNQAKGQLSAILSTKVTSFLNDLNKKEKDALGKRLDAIITQVTDPFNISSSPTFIQGLEQQLDQIFLGKKKSAKATRGVSKVRLSRRISSNRSEAKKLQAIIAKRTKNLQALAAARAKKKKFIIPTITLKAIINEALAEYIRIRMGRSTDPAIKLRYQTGRFAESARVLTLNRTETGALLGTYEFMRDPYGTFLPGGRLHTQQRDPQIYIEGAIRDIAVQVLKRQFNGIALELK